MRNFISHITYYSHMFVFQGSRQAIASVFKKLHGELQDIATLHEAINTDSKMMIIVTLKQTENKTEDKS